MDWISKRSGRRQRKGRVEASFVEEIVSCVEGAQSHATLASTVLLGKGESQGGTLYKD